MSQSEHSELQSSSRPEALEGNGKGSPATGVLSSAAGDPQDDAQIEETPPLAMGKRGWILSGAIAALLLGVVGWRLWMMQIAQGPMPPGGPPGALVKIDRVQTGTLTESNDYIASLESRRSVNLQPQAEGRVTQIFVNEGDSVNQGDPILQVDSDQQAASVSGAAAAADTARATVAEQQATLKSLEAQRLSVLSNLRYAQRQYQRLSQLYSEGAVSQQQRDEQLDNFRVAQANLGQINQQIQAQQAQISAAANSLQQAQANVREQQVELQYYRVNAPFAGTVGDIPVKVGDFVTTATNLASLTQNQSLEVNISIPLERAPELRIGMPVELLDGQGQRVTTSSIAFISPTVNNQTQSVLVKARISNSDNERLRTDQFVRARVIWDRRPGILIPTTAVSRLAGQTFVFVAEQGRSPQGQPQLVARQKPVKLGDIQNNRYPVLAGLQPGEEIITSGLLTLRDGAPIVPESQQPL